MLSSTEEDMRQSSTKYYDLSLLDQEPRPPPKKNQRWRSMRHKLWRSRRREGRKISNYASHA
jgi:hypothetical protein